MLFSFETLYAYLSDGEGCKKEPCCQTANRERGSSRRMKASIQTSCIHCYSVVPLLDFVWPPDTDQTSNPNTKLSVVCLSFAVPRFLPPPTLLLALVSSVSVCRSGGKTPVASGRFDRMSAVDRGRRETVLIS